MSKINSHIHRDVLSDVSEGCEVNTVELGQALTVSPNPISRFIATDVVLRSGKDQAVGERGIEGRNPSAERNEMFLADFK